MANIIEEKTKIEYSAPDSQISILRFEINFLEISKENNGGDTPDVGL